MAQAKSALAVYFDAQDKAHPGYVLDYLKEAKQSLYYAYGYPEDTHDSVNEAMFGYLASAILGSGVEKNALVEMVCAEGVWEFKNEKTTLSNKETVWFVK
jgi:beta-galactosidase/beta-glucuronidase